MECDLYFGSQGRVLAVLEWVEVVEAELVGWCGPALVPCPASTPHPHTGGPRPTVSHINNQGHSNQAATQEVWYDRTPLLVVVQDDW